MPSEDSWIPEDFEMSSELVLRIGTFTDSVPHLQNYYSELSRASPFGPIEGAAAYQNSALNLPVSARFTWDTRKLNNSYGEMINWPRSPG